jgi:septum formation protein
MLKLLSGRDHRVLTAVVLRKAAAADRIEHLSETVVTFRPLTEATIRGYIATGEPLDKAGSYGIQGQGAMLVRSIRGSYTNVVGLPLCETVELLERTGLYTPFEGGERP